MSRGAPGLGLQRSRTARARPHVRDALRVLALLFLLVSRARGQAELGLNTETDRDPYAVTWWIATLEWGAGTAVGTGVGILNDKVGSIQIPATNTPLDVPIGIMNNVVVPVAVSSPFGCAVGCDAVGLTTGREGILWYGFAMGALGEIVTEPFGEWAYDRTGNEVLRRLIPAAVGSVAAVAGYNGWFWLEGGSTTETQLDYESTSEMYERQAHIWQTLAIETPSGVAMAAAGGLILPRWLHLRPDSLGELSPGARTTNRLMDIFVVYPITCVVGIDAAAMILHRQNEFWIGYLGAALGTAAVVGVGDLAGFGKQLDEKPLARLLPAVAAGIVGAIGYNSMDIEDDVADGRGRFIGPVLVSAGPSRDPGATGIDFDLRLMTVRF